MTGGSLGLRTGSYGSLQPQLQNGVALPIQSTPVSARKTPKMLPLGSREKEKIILPWICKLCGKRKVGMLLLLIASVAVFLSFISVINKDDDASSGLETDLFSSDNFWPMMNGDIKSPYTLGGHLASVNNEMENISSSGSLSSVPFFSPSILPVQHPCENISLSPLQIDRKRTGPRPCPVCYVPAEQAVFYMPAFPSKSPVLKNLTYVVEENSFSNESSGGSIFGGHPSLNQRNDSFDIKESMTVHCGFVGGKKPGQGTGFDIDDDDLLEMDKCHDVVVASAIFGKYDVMQQPKNISEVSKRSVCFYMFLDEETEAYIKNSSSVDSTKRVGLWRIVVVRNLPYEDARRNGKRERKSSEASAGYSRSFFAGLPNPLKLSGLGMQRRQSCDVFPSFSCFLSFAEVLSEIISILSRSSMLNHARCLLLDDMPKRLVSHDEQMFVDLIAAYGRAGIPQEAIKLFRRLPELGVDRTLRSYDALFKAILRRGSVLMAKRVFNSMTRDGVLPAVSTYNILIWGFCLSMKMETAKRFFTEKMLCNAQKFCENSFTLLNFSSKL